MFFYFLRHYSTLFYSCAHCSSPELLSVQSRVFCLHWQQNKEVSWWVPVRVLAKVCQCVAWTEKYLVPGAPKSKRNSRTLRNGHSFFFLVNCKNSWQLVICNGLVRLDTLWNENHLFLDNKHSEPMRNTQFVAMLIFFDKWGKQISCNSVCYKTRRVQCRPLLLTVPKER